YPGLGERDQLKPFTTTPIDQRKKGAASAAPFALVPRALLLVIWLDRDRQALEIFDGLAIDRRWLISPFPRSGDHHLVVLRIDGGAHHRRLNGTRLIDDELDDAVGDPHDVARILRNALLNRIRRRRFRIAGRIEGSRWRRSDDRLGLGLRLRRRRRFHAQVAEA